MICLLPTQKDCNKSHTDDVSYVMDYSNVVRYWIVRNNAFNILTQAKFNKHLLRFYYESDIINTKKSISNKNMNQTFVSELLQNDIEFTNH